MAGMLAARVLSETFERVTILDRDVLPYEAVARAGVPQGKHLHVLLPRGLAIAEDFFPGLPLDLEAAGAVPMDIARDLAWLTPQGTTAGLAACALREILRTNGKNPDVLGRKFQRRIARINRAPWGLATSEDLRFRSVEGARRDGPTRCLHWYVDELLNAARGDTIVRKAFLDVQGMLRGPERIFAPGIAARVLTNAVKRRANGSPDA